MDHHNVAVRQFDFLVLGLDFRVVPFRNFAHEDINDGRAVEFEFWVARQIVSQDIRPGDRRDVQDFAWCFGKVVIAHRAV